ncbi:MAG TPA: M20/M25/M40 family metallo-hydrolase [Chloroflexota bacterium]|nr:M20/M25/M40 family metallo-hydrolase [Chloroflexota bacterium]
MTEPNSRPEQVIDWDAVTRQAADILSRYVRIDSSHPRGRTVETAALIGEILAAENIEYQIYQSPDEGKVNLVARLHATDPVGKPLLLSNHMDVVQAVAADWRFDPFSGEIADGYVYGRGALDMKSMGVMELITMLLLKRHNVALARDVILLCTCDEEIGSPMGARWMVEQHFDALDPAFVLDEGGRGMKGFFSAGDAFEITVGEKRILWVKMIARAEPGHASQPWPDAATHRLVRAAHAVLTEPPEDRESPPVAELIKRLGGATARHEIAAYRATSPLLHDTISLTMLSGGYKINIIPEQAEMSFDCRLLPDTDARAFVSNLDQLINDPNVELEVRWPDSPATIDAWDNPLFLALEAACKEYRPGAIVSPSICVGGTDARHFRERGVPAFGLLPGLFDAEDLKGYHGINERVSLDNLRLGTQIVLSATMRIAAR